MSDNAAAGPPLGTEEWWDDYFSPGGGWERNGGREQTRIFAQRFCQRVRFDRTGDFALLDFGCALGEGLRVFHARYPKAVLTGMDFSAVAISRCRRECGEIARFEVGGLGDLGERYDVIYTSNVLEHFVDYREAAQSLLEHCNRLCVMVPYEELQEDRPLDPDAARHHQHTFTNHTFDYLVDEGLATSVRTHVFPCPEAWGWDWRKRLKTQLGNLRRRVLRKQPATLPRQIIYDIQARR